MSCLLMFEWMWNVLIFFLVRHFSILGLSIFGDIIFFSAVWAFHVYSSLSGCGMPYFFWSDIFPFWDLVFFSILIFFSAVWAFHVYSYLSGFEIPYFFVALHFIIPTHVGYILIAIFSNFQKAEASKAKTNRFASAKDLKF